MTRQSVIHPRYILPKLAANSQLSKLMGAQRLQLFKDIKNRLKQVSLEKSSRGKSEEANLMSCFFMMEVAINHISWINIARWISMAITTKIMSYVIGSVLILTVFYSFFWHAVKFQDLYFVFWINLFNVGKINITDQKVKQGLLKKCNTNLNRHI